VRAGHDRFVFTSTTSLMISQAIREENGAAAVWLDEAFGPLAPRNIYGVTKLTAEGLCRLHHAEHGLNCVVLRTGRFFPEDDDTLDDLPGLNLKANEFLNRRLTVEDAATAHLLALEQAPSIRFETLIVSAPVSFGRHDAEALKADAPAVIARYFPDAPTLYAQRNWRLPTSIGRVYDPGRAERILGFRGETDFGQILAALRADRPLPFVHDPAYSSPSEQFAPRAPDAERPKREGAG
jgi:UDP-glucose 4-epimerase